MTAPTTSQRGTDALVHVIPLAEPPGADPERLLAREWLVTNGLGGYASGTVLGVATRRYHGLLVAALPNPLGRTMMLNRLDADVTAADGTAVRLGGEERAGGHLELADSGRPSEFRLEAGLPVWRYRIGGAILERRVILPHRQNSVFVNYHYLEGNGPLRLALRPAVNFRSHDASVSSRLQDAYTLTTADGGYLLSAHDRMPPLRMRIVGTDAAFDLGEERIDDLRYRVEAHRGYEHEGTLWTPGAFAATLEPGEQLTFVASTESREVMEALTPEAAYRAELERRRRLLAAAHPEARRGLGAELVLAADQFVITPVGRVIDMARAHASGDEVRTVIAGYHWFTDWGRDTMISLEGLTLTTGREREAGFILRTFAHYVRDGLIPNMFPEGEQDGLYHTADATLWFFHAVHRYVEATGDRWTLRIMLPQLLDIVARHLGSTRFGIGVDPADGLLRQGAEGYQLTWMDAKVEEWVVTPRRGKAVELNALWYNALRLLEGWLRAERAGEADAIAAHAERARASFNQRFWYEDGGYLYDVVDGEDGDDPACRPNQLFAVSLDHPVLDRARWDSVVETVRERLLTPAGLRSLAPGHPDYKPKYYGDLRARDAAYHQGTVWGWLIGPWVDAWLTLHPDDRAGARQAVECLGERMSEFGVGSIAEIFDAEAPFTPRGCIAQAWSVAEALRCWVRTAPG